MLVGTNDAIICIGVSVGKRDTVPLSQQPLYLLYTEERRRKRKTQVFIFKNGLQRGLEGGLAVSAAKMGCCCGKNNNCKKCSQLTN